MKIEGTNHMEKIDYRDPKFYENRELSWMKFNERILSEARTKSLPLFERLKFLSITASNLDEFFMIRVASLKDMVHADYNKPDIAGLTPRQQLEKLNRATHGFVEQQYVCYNRSLLPALKKQNLKIVSHHERLTEKQQAFADDYFDHVIYPVLTPMAVDSSRPFPLIRNKSLNLGSVLQKEKETQFATVQVPGVLPRILELPDEEGRRCCILLEEVIERNIHKLYTGYEVLCTHPYRIMRNADLSIEEDEAADLLKEIQKKLKKRQWGEIIRLEIEESMDKRLLKWLRRELSVKEDDIYAINGPLDLTFLLQLYALEGFDDLKEPEHHPAPVEGLSGQDDIFAAIRKKDILLHHPYQSFDPVVDFIRQAADDPQTLAIKQTLYRVSGHSPIISALARAAENGKQVTVLVELKARFDEENNIVWAKMLEKAGCHVIYGLVGLKTHSKITLVVRMEEDGIRRYVHLGTGNYNDSTAKLYTDMGLLTCSVPIGEDATALFNMISGYSEPLSWNKLYIAPIWLRDAFTAMIRREAAIARTGKPARILAKMNSLCDREIIAELYQAAADGVEIDLIVRGICSLKTGVEGTGGRIRVRSIVGNFLEHSRIYYFYNNGAEDIYLASADWMPRNLDKRVEIMFPVESPELKEEVKHILDIQLQDTLKSHLLAPDGTYVKQDLRGKAKLGSQAFFVREAQERSSAASDPVADRVFVPETPA